MKILLIRHGESTGNRDHLWAGITDHELTAHGFLQAQRLADHLATQLADKDVSIHCSDLLRARRTATAVADKLTAGHLNVNRLLREQDLGWREGLTFKTGDRSDPLNAKKMREHAGESKADMDVRAVSFIDLLQPFTHDLSKTLIIVSHGLFLLRLYAALVSKLAIINAPAPMWSNTGVLTIQINKNDQAAVSNVNALPRLQGLKRTRGVGSASYDAKQQKVSAFFSPNRTKLQGEVKSETTSLPEAENDLAASIKAIDAACAAARTSSDAV